MSVMYLALPVALLLVLAAFLAFRWCIQTGQLDDLDNVSYRMLHDDAARTAKSHRTGNQRTRTTVSKEQTDKHDASPT